MKAEIDDDDSCLDQSIKITDSTNMNALEIIEEIKRLPEDERGKVIEFMRHIPNVETIEAINEPTEGLPRFNTVEELFEELNR